MRLTQLGQLVTHVSLEGGGNLWESPLSAQRGVGTSGRVHCQLRGGVGTVVLRCLVVGDNSW